MKPYFLKVLMMLNSSRNYSKETEIYRWNMSEWIKLNCLIPGIVACHVTFATVDAHFRVDQGHDMLPVRQIVPNVNTFADVQSVLSASCVVHNLHYKFGDKGHFIFPVRINCY